MLKLLRGAVIAVVFATGLSAMLAIAVSTGSSAAASGQEIAQALRAGGLVIVLRHGATFPDKADTDPLNFDNIRPAESERKGQDARKAIRRCAGQRGRGLDLSAGQWQLQAVGAHSNG